MEHVLFMIMIRFTFVDVKLMISRSYIKFQNAFPHPIGSMYAIYGNIYH
jgi:hypothetical protein